MRSCYQSQAPLVVGPQLIVLLKGMHVKSCCAALHAGKAVEVLQGQQQQWQAAKVLLTLARLPKHTSACGNGTFLLQAATALEGAEEVVRTSITPHPTPLCRTGWHTAS